MTSPVAKKALVVAIGILLIGSHAVAYVYGSFSGGRQEATRIRKVQNKLLHDAIELALEQSDDYASLTLGSLPSGNPTLQGRIPQDVKDALEKELQMRIGAIYVPVILQDVVETTRSD